MEVFDVPGHDHPFLEIGHFQEVFLRFFDDVVRYDRSNSGDVHPFGVTMPFNYLHHLRNKKVFSLCIKFFIFQNYLIRRVFLRIHLETPYGLIYGDSHLNVD